MRQHRGLGDARRATGVLEDGEVVRAGAGVKRIRRRRERLAHRDRTGIAGEPLAVAVLLLPREREEDPQNRRHLLFDVRDDHVLDRGAHAGGLDDGVQAREGDDAVRNGEGPAKAGRHICVLLRLVRDTG